MKPVWKYSVFVVLIIFFNCILIGVFKLKALIPANPTVRAIDNVIRNAKCETDVCIRVCCNKEDVKCFLEDEFEDIRELEEAESLTKTFSILKVDADDPELCKGVNERLFKIEDPYTFTKVCKNRYGDVHKLRDH